MKAAYLPYQPYQYEQTTFMLKGQCHEICVLVCTEEGSGHGTGIWFASGIRAGCNLAKLYRDRIRLVFSYLDTIYYKYLQVIQQLYIFILVKCAYTYGNCLLFMIFISRSKLQY